VFCCLYRVVDRAKSEAVSSPRGEKEDPDARMEDVADKVTDDTRVEVVNEEENCGKKVEVDADEGLRRQERSSSHGSEREHEERSTRSLSLSPARDRARGDSVSKSGVEKDDSDAEEGAPESPRVNVRNVGGVAKKDKSVAEVDSQSEAGKSASRSRSKSPAPAAESGKKKHKSRRHASKKSSRSSKSSKSSSKKSSKSKRRSSSKSSSKSKKSSKSSRRSRKHSSSSKGGKEKEVDGEKVADEEEVEAATSPVEGKGEADKKQFTRCR